MSAVELTASQSGKEGLAHRSAPASQSLFYWAVLVLVGMLTLVPILFLILGSFSLARLPNDFSLENLGLANYAAVWFGQNIHLVFANTIIYVIGSTVVGITLASALAWLVERTDLPGKIWVYAGVPLGLAVPGMLAAISWVLLLSPRSGFINRMAMEGGADGPIFNINSLTGMIFVEGLRLVPVAFLMLVPLLRSMDPALEEAAAVSGAGPVRTLRRVTLMVMLPGLLAITIYQAVSALEVFEVPGILGMPAGIHVFATRVYNIVDNVGTVPAFGQANALAMLYLVLAGGVSFFYFRLVRHSERFTVVTGKGYRPKVIELGKWRLPALFLVVLYLIVSIVLPLIVMFYASLVGYLQQPSWAAVETFSLQHYTKVFHNTRFMRAMTNTLLLTLGTATVVTLLSFVISYIVVRTRFVGRYALDVLSFLPHSIPGIVLGLALFWCFLQIDQLTGLKLFGSITSIVIGLTILFLSYSVRAMSAAMLQIHKDLEEAALVSGARPWRVALKVFVPLLLPSLVGVWIYVALLSVRMASVPLMLGQGARNEVLATIIWYLWEEGDIESVGALGVMLMVLMFGLSIGLRLLAFGKKTGGGPI